MTCPLPPKRWWLELKGGLLRSPQAIMRAIRRDQAEEMPEPSRFLGAPADTAHFSAPKRLMFPYHFNSDGHLKQMNRADWQHCDPRLMKWAARLQEDARKAGVPLYVHSAFRTKAEQMELLARGVTKAPYPRSAHCIGEAVDIVHGVFHWELTQQEWAYIHALGLRALDKVNAGVKARERLSLNWGGPDKPNDTFGWDPAHWEITDFRDRIRPLSVGEPRRYTARKILSL